MFRFVTTLFVIKMRLNITPTCHNPQRAHHKHITSQPHHHHGRVSGAVCSAKNSCMRVRPCARTPRRRCCRQPPVAAAPAALPAAAALLSPCHCCASATHNRQQQKQQQRSSGGAGLTGSYGPPAPGVGGSDDLSSVGSGAVTRSSGGAGIEGIYALVHHSGPLWRPVHEQAHTAQP